MCTPGGLTMTGSGRQGTLRGGYEGREERRVRVDELARVEGLAMVNKWVDSHSPDHTRPSQRARAGGSWAVF